MTAAPSALADVARARYLTGLWFGIVGAVLFSGKAVIVKLGYVHGADAITLLALRMVFAAPFFALTAWWIERRGRTAEWRRGDRARIVGLGIIGYYLASFLDFLGLQYITVALERVILYLNPTLVLLISALVLRRPIDARQGLALAIAYAGVLFVFWHDLSLAGSNVALGSALVLASALAYAIYLVVGGEMVRRLGPIRLTSYSTLVACAACVAQALVVDAPALFAQAPEVYGLSLVNGLLCTVVPVFLVMAAVERVGSSVAAQTGMIGPAATIAFGAVLLGEPVTAAQLTGTAVVVAGIFILTTRRKA